MPKLTVAHEAPLELIKQHPALAVDLLRAVTGTPLRAGLDVRLASTSLNTVTPVQYSADSVVVVSDPDSGEALVAIIVEPQGRDEKTKKFSWPVYLANARREIGCDSAFLIVVCPDPAEAKGCREVIPLGHPGLELWPIVIDPEHAPGDEDAGPYMLLFLACLPALDMETMEWKSDFIESYEERGLEQGSLTTKRKDVLKVLDVRRLRPTDAQRAQVEASTDLAQLDLWFERSLTAATAADVFKD